MTGIIVFSQNEKIESLQSLKGPISDCSNVVILTTHMLFDNEKRIIDSILGQKCYYEIFADYLSDEENERCDRIAYELSGDLYSYIDEVKHQKNAAIVDKIQKKYSEVLGFVCTNDLGVDQNVWINEGFRKQGCTHYYNSLHIKKRLLKNSFWGAVYKKITSVNKKNITDEVYVSSFEGKKLVFIGKMQRVGYRTCLQWEKSSYERKMLIDGKFYNSDKCIYLSSLHEHEKLENTGVHLSGSTNIVYIQDGYLPPNDSCRYLLYYPSNVKYYAWDLLGTYLFRAYDLPVEIMPFRTVLYLKKVSTEHRIRNVLVATSASGDWTAQKNRSDEDKLFLAFVEVAKKFKDISFVYRCHPTWVLPTHNGINSINRARNYVESIAIKNFVISSNIPTEKNTASFSRSSLEEDLKKADIVFGEHSISMVDAGLEGIPFASVNLTGRRNLFVGITDLGFPHCESVEDICDLINGVNKGNGVVQKYNAAVEKYNEMSNVKRGLNDFFLC